eukprot:TRINITY_DN110900_c0_g1_i1.p1 TRINITY_DN110900_c0_g1~~TRINITY_DN110900_c0_g1_i1.p1  ORF type:complete len:300 (+),score=49.73 TRINITY_DN110900_c0_g1_i1:36-902(+)
MPPRVRHLIPWLLATSLLQAWSGRFAFVRLALRPRLASPSVSTWAAGARQQALRTLRRAGAVAAEGMKIQLDFKLALDTDGSVIDSSAERGPMQFICGERQVMPAIDAGVQGMAVGESRAIPLKGDAGFGERDEKKLIAVPMKNMPPEAQVGSEMTIPGPRGDMLGRVVKLGQDSAILDLNHPLAGLDLTMTVTLVNCENLPEDEKVAVEMLSPGDGKTYPKPGNRLSIHYVGTLAADGSVFESTREDGGGPFKFQLGTGQVIKGWDRGLLRMSLGERALLRIPAKLG